jgi:hypothetical protein
MSTLTHHAAIPREQAAGLLAGLLAIVGVALMAVIGYSILRWIGSDAFTPTVSDPESWPSYFHWLIPLLQFVITPLFAALSVWHFLIAPWRRTGRLTFEGMLVIGALTLLCTDSLINYIVFAFSFSSAFVNMGNWGPFIPGHVAPTQGTIMPWPLIYVPLTYLWFVVLWVSCGTVLLRALHRRMPGRLFLPLLICYIVDVLLDVVLEGFINVRLGLYAFLTTYEPLTLFAGTRYQFPLYNALLWGAVMTVLVATRYYTDEQGLTFIEASARRLTASPRRQTLVSVLAVIGFMNLTYFVLYFVPYNVFNMNAGPFPADLPAHLLNGYCGAGGLIAECPGPGVPLHRP